MKIVHAQTLKTIQMQIVYCDVSWDKNEIAQKLTLSILV